MSGVSLPVTRPGGRTMLVGAPTSRAQPLLILQGLGYQCDEADDPYTALVALLAEPASFRSVVLCLASLYREELAAIATIKQRLTHVDVWLAQTDGRHSLMAEAIRLSADGLLAEDGLHRIAIGARHPSHAEPIEPEPDHGLQPVPAPPSTDDSAEVDMEMTIGEPILSADELRALLAEPPFHPPRDTA